MCYHQTFQSNRKLHITTSNHVLNFELPKACLEVREVNTCTAATSVHETTHRESKFLDDSGILSCSQS